MHQKMHGIPIYSGTLVRLDTINKFKNVQTSFKMIYLFKM